VTSLLDFYQEYGISPVRQDVTDLSAHFARRAALYRSLGLWPLSIHGKYILEVGAGSGENALYTQSLHPAEYTILEPNPVGAADIRRRGLRARVVEQRIEDFASFHFDVVLCEGLLGLCGTNPLELLESVARHVTPGGVLVITCIDPISQCAEVWRRSLAVPFIDRSATISDQLAALRPVFTPHLATLKGMTRSVDDWILDNILNPASIGPTFSIPEACEALEGRFDVLGCSPRLLTDWRWYKASSQGNQWAIDAYWRQAHNLLDYRVYRPERAIEKNRVLYENCVTYRQDVHQYEQGLADAPDCTVIGGDPAGWFGRGQQYLSFVRR